MKELLAEPKERKVVTLTGATANGTAAAICDDGTLWVFKFVDVNGPAVWVRLPPIPQGDGKVV